ncbi:MAG: ComEC/Rec2 family competence protein, partial [Planctomycetota bacterium]
GIGQRFERRLATYVRPGQRDLAQAILLGARERLDSNTYTAFIRTGTIHLLVVSGLHVGLLALAIWAIVCSGALPRQTGLIVTAVLVIGYAFVAGARPPVVRACVIVVLTLMSYALGRRISPVNLLSAAILAVLVINPTELFRSGTQLSFLCVATLAAYGMIFQRQRTIDPLTRLIRDTQPTYRKLLRWIAGNFKHTALASLAIWLATAPLIAYHFHITSPVSILVTPLIWPLVAIALITGLSICLVGWILPPIAWVLGEICSLCLQLTESIVASAYRWHGGNFYLSGPAGWWVIGFYAGLALLAIFWWGRLRWTWQLAAVVTWIAIGLTATGWRTADNDLRCTFLSVGHGTCVVLELPGGETLLYDAGSLGSPDRAAQTISSFLWSRGISRLDGVVLSHADVDHYNALPGLIDRFEVANVYVSPLMFDPWMTEGQLDAPNYLKQTLESSAVPLQQIWLNDRLRTSSKQIEIEVLHPPHSGVAGRDNANSLLLAIRYGQCSLLLPGDLESPGIDAVMAELPQHFDILLAPHHGSRNSDPPGFASWCTPDWVVVSGPPVGDEQQFTAESYRDVGAKVLHTATVGAVEFVIDQDGLTCTRFSDRSVE